MILPVFKLGTLVLKTLSKPIASRIKQQAAFHPRFRDFIISVAQANHRMTTTMQRRIYGHATDVEIRPLNEEKAVQAAVDLIGELFVFSVAGGLLIFEVQRSARSEAKKEEKRRQEMAELVQEMRERDENRAREIELLWHKIEEMEQPVHKRGLSDILKFKNAEADNAKLPKAA